MSYPDKQYDFLNNKLIELGLSGLHGSPYDNSFSVFQNEPREINLVTIGTNGNTTDAINTNAEWLKKSYENQNYSNLLDGYWAVKPSSESPLRSRLISLPTMLNNVFVERPKFSAEKMICTNTILVASAGVAGISQALNQEIFGNHTPLTNVKAVVNASLEFFFDGTLALCCPEVIFSYGNSLSGYSAWKLIKERSTTLSETVITEQGNTFRFARIQLSSSQTSILIGWPHPSWGRYKLREDVIAAGINALNL